MWNIFHDAKKIVQNFSNWLSAYHIDSGAYGTVCRPSIVCNVMYTVAKQYVGEGWRYTVALDKALVKKFL